MTWLPLTRRPGGLQSYKVIMPPAHRATAEPDQQSHQGYEWMYVLSDSLHLRLAEHDLTLIPGEVAEFDTRAPHWFGNPDPTPTKVLFLFGPQGERLHVRARPTTRQHDTPYRPTLRTKRSARDRLAARRD